METVDILKSLTQGMNQDDDDLEFVVNTSLRKSKRTDKQKKIIDIKSEGTEKSNIGQSKENIKSDSNSNPFKRKQNRVKKNVVYSLDDDDIQEIEELEVPSQIVSLNEEVYVDASEEYSEDIIEDTEELMDSDSFQGTEVLEELVDMPDNNGFVDVSDTSLCVDNLDDFSDSDDIEEQSESDDIDSDFVEESFDDTSFLSDEDEDEESDFDEDCLKEGSLENGTLFEDFQGNELAKESNEDFKLGLDKSSEEDSENLSNISSKPSFEEDLSEGLEENSNKDSSVESENNSFENDKFKNCIYHQGMSVEEFLKENPNYRNAEYVEHFYDKNYLKGLVRQGLLLMRKGQYKH